MTSTSPHFQSTPGPAFEFVNTPEVHTGPNALDAEERSKIFLYTVHDGDSVPTRYWQTEDGQPRLPVEELNRAFARERDWGANLVARALAEELGLEGYGRVRIARVLLDFNRFPGATPPGVRDPLERMAINPPMCDALDHGSKMAALQLYDEISADFEPRLRGKLITMGVHTYDEHNPSQTSRPHLSLVTRPGHYQREARMPYGVFDPMYPDVLGESTASRVLCNRMSLNLERVGFRVSENHPYALPEGSVEVRAQVWSFFSYVRERFGVEAPQTADDPAYQAVWKMLLNTNLRGVDGEALRGYLHRFRHPPAPQAELFAAAQIAYRKIEDYLASGTLVRDYRRWAERPSSIGLEVRKDLLCGFDSTTGQPRPASHEQQGHARSIAAVIAGAVRTYFATDRDATADPLDA